jgi:hypothetical protein
MSTLRDMAVTAVRMLLALIGSCTVSPTADGDDAAAPGDVTTVIADVAVED